MMLAMKWFSKLDDQLVRPGLRSGAINVAIKRS